MNAPKENLHFVSLLGMNSSQNQEFTRRVKVTGGIVPIFIHPYHRDRESGLYIPDENKTEYSKYRFRRDAQIRSLLSFNAPLVVFDVSRLNDDLLTRLEIAASKSTYAENKTLYLVNASKDSPNPVNSNWSRIGQVFKKAQAHTINIGGDNWNENVKQAAAMLELQGLGILHNLVTLQ